MTDITQSALQSLREIDDSKAPTGTITRAEARAILGHVAMLTEQLKADNPRLQGAGR
jgi:hypothetical protein